MRSSSGSTTVVLFFGGGPDSDSLPSLPDVESSLEGAGGGAFFDFFFFLDGCSSPELLLSLPVRLRFLEDADLEEVAAADFFVDLVVRLAEAADLGGAEVRGMRTRRNSIVFDEFTTAERSPSRTETSVWMHQLNVESTEEHTKESSMYSQFTAEGAPSRNEEKELQDHHFSKQRSPKKVIQDVPITETATASR